MKCFNDIVNKRLVFILLAAVFCLVPRIGGAECDCTKDTGIPPFLAEGATPNLLLMVDNSASMYDVAYHDATKESWECFDDSYNSADSYTGYFDEATWYLYDGTDGRFEPAVSAPSGAAAFGGTVFTSDSASLELTGNETDGWVFEELYAIGNLLNWATSSKFDIEKKILTGGKYDGTQLVSEGRGCSGYRFVKEVTLTSGGTSYQLTMGIRSDDYDGTTEIEAETTVIDIFEVSETGYDYDACRTAMDEVMYGTGNPQNAVGNCIDPNNEADSPGKQVLIHSTTDCWKYWKGDLSNWPQHTESLLGFCQDVYESGTDPKEITPADPEYACFGYYNAVYADATGYIGRCYNATASTCTQVGCADIGDYEDSNKILYQCGAGGIEYCTDLDHTGNTYWCAGTWTPLMECTGGAGGGWMGEYDGTGTIPDELDTCMYDAMAAYCDATEVPQVVDPSDSEFSTGEVYNLPAILTDGGLEGQLSEPIANLNVRLQESDPSGLLQEFSNEIRIGAMAFNYDGSDSECSESNPYITYDCGNEYNQDGAQVIQAIGSDDETAGHMDSLVAAINDTKADAWTPLAEAMYTAIGYYAQDFGMELNPSPVDPNDSPDFSSLDAPITEYCQSNNVLFITDGASTADLNSDVTAFYNSDILTMTTPENDGDDANDCGALYGSSYFDDLAYYARQGDIYSDGIYAFEESPGVDVDPENINTWIVYTGDTGDTGDECNAYTLMQNAVANGGPNAVTSPGTDEVYLGGDATDLSQALRDAFENIIKRAAAGSAASVISATRSGEGAVYQAIFWPAKTGPEVAGEQLPDVTWTGEVHALLMDSDGNLYEDTDSDHALDLNADEHVVFYFSEDANETVACYGELDDDGDCTGTVKSLDEVKYLWSAAEWLSGITDANITVNRASYISNVQRRYIYTWNDLDNDGIVDTSAPDEMIALEDDIDWNGLGVTAPRGAVPYDFGIDPGSVADANAEVDAIVNWIRGQDATGYRTRTLATPANFDIGSDTITWRLGDVIYSTPTSVARPEENYHLVYRDDSYVDFVSEYKNRRHMVYFGANDGMIHAVNGGFYDATTNKFWKGYEDTDSDGVFEFTDPAGAPALGAEMWAYVPYNLLPQLKCLRETSYSSNHKYFVDLKPRIFDVEIFADDDDHPNGWGTIMVAGMRFGGGSVDADAAGDTRKFVSAYMIFDVTNPEAPPELLGELTYEEGSSAHLGYTTMVPVVTPMKETIDGTVYTKWYLILGSGPLVLDGFGDWEYNTAIKGVSNQAGKIAVIPLDTLVSGNPFRIPTTAPDDSTAGIIPLMDDQGTEDVADDTEVVGFVSDPISVDFDLSNDYRADAVYFGTVEGDWDGWAGRLYRLVTNADSGISDPGTWELKEMLNPQRPVTAAPMAGWDGQNFWIYFGTGRFFDEDDKSNAGSNEQESYYGLKEPVSCDDGFTFEWPKLSIDALLQVGSIRVSESADVATSVLSCYDFDSATETYSEDATGACIPGGVTNFSELDTYIAGTGCVENEGVLEHTGTAGWAHAFDLSGERNLGQATLLGGLLTFATYQPFDDLCRLEGEAYLYGVYFRTGTAWHESVFDDGGTDPVEYKKDLGRGLATTPNLHVGQEEGGTAYAQTSTGAIVEIEQPNMPIDAVKTGRMYWRSD